MPSEIQRKPCALCGRTDLKMTKEHIYGDWMLAELERSGFPLTPSREIISYYINESRGCTSAFRKEPEHHHALRLRVLC